MHYTWTDRWMDERTGDDDDMLRHRGTGWWIQHATTRRRRERAAKERGTRGARMPVRLLTVALQDLLHGRVVVRVAGEWYRGDGDGDRSEGGTEPNMHRRRRRLAAPDKGEVDSRRGVG